MNPTLSARNLFAHPLTIAIALSLSTHGALLFEEPFDYPTGGLAGNANDGSTWTNLSGGAFRNAVEANSTSPSHTPAFDASGGSFSQISNARASLVLDAAIAPGAPGDVRYISFVQKLSFTANRTQIIEFWKGSAVESNTVFSFGVDTNTTAPDYGLLINKGNPSAVALEVGSASLEARLVVIKVEYGEGDNDSISVFLDPVDFEPTTPDATTNYPDLSFDQLGFGAFQRSSQMVDEIRIGTTYEDVVPAFLDVQLAAETAEPSSDAALSSEAAFGSLVGTFSSAIQGIAIDPNATYSLVAGTGDDDNSLFTISNNELRSDSFLNSSAGTTLSVRVQAIGGGKTTERTYDIFIIDDSASLLFEESFAYFIGGIRSDFNDGFFWDYVNGGDSQNAVVSGSISPAHLENYNASGNSFSQTASGRASIELNPSVAPGDTGDVRYISFVQKLAFPTNKSQIVEFWRGAATASNTVFSFGTDTNTAAPSYGLLVDKSASSAIALEVGEANLEARLVIIKVEYGAANSDTISVFLDPPSAEPASPDATANYPDLSFDRIGFGSFQGGAQMIDEFRIGISYEEVVPAFLSFQISPRITGLDEDTDASVSAQSPAGTAVATLTSFIRGVQIDPNYSLVAGAGDGDNALFAIVGSELQTVGSLTSLTGDTLSIRLRSRGAGQTIETIYQVLVIDEALTPASLSVGTVSPFLNGNFPPRTPSPGTGALTVLDAFPNLSFSELIGISVEPRADYLFVQERDGSVFRISTDESTTEKTSVFSTNVAFDSNGGFRSFICHPDFNLTGSPHRDDAFIFYSTRTSGQFVYRLSRITRGGDGNFANEVVMIQLRTPQRGQHFAGSLAFDQDGFLMVGFGDLELSFLGVELYQDSQRIDRNFQSSILRLDVDMQGGSISSPATRTLQGGTVNGIATDKSMTSSHPYDNSLNHSGISYFIPSDNYFVQNPPAAGSGGTGPSDTSYPAHGDALGEVHALGVRNPWRMAYDPVDHDVVWFSVGSNGTERYEEIELLVPGGNYGWPFAESTFSDSAETNRFTPPSAFAPIYLGVTDSTNPKQTDPLWSYPSTGTGDRAITGGVMYRGTLHPSLTSKLVYGDSASGRIWSLDYKGKTKANFVNTEIIDSDVAIRHLIAGPQGEEIYLVDGNGIYRIGTDDELNPEPPALLSQTGAFSDLANLTPSAGLIPYEPGSPLWSDRADKLRWAAIPNSEGKPGVFDQASERIVFSENNEWTFPIGSVFVKHFSLPLDEGNPGGSLRRLETRFLVLGDNDVYYLVTYRWRADGSDADLISSGESETFTILDTSGSSYTQTWDYPSRQDCLQCHRAGGDSVLGFQTSQLNSLLNYDGGSDFRNQLMTLKSLDLFAEPSFETAQVVSYLESAAIDDFEWPLDHRVRSYLDSNCAMCHNGVQNGQAQFDARLHTPLALTGMIDADPEAGDLGVIGSKIVASGNPDHSVLFIRDGATDGNQMPPLSRNVPHDVYLDELRAWILQLSMPEYRNWVATQNVLRGPLDDEDGDGSLNLAEFVHGTDPHSDSSRFTPQLDASGFFQFPVTGAARADLVGIAIEDSGDLVQWYQAGALNSESTIISDTSSSGMDGLLRSQLNMDQENRFIRAHFQIPSN